jgi:hypothetical protein
LIIFLPSIFDPDENLKQNVEGAGDSGRETRNLCKAGENAILESCFTLNNGTDGDSRPPAGDRRGKDTGSVFRLACDLRKFGCQPVKRLVG